MLLEVEADQDMANDPGSLMDMVMVGIITSYSANSFFLAHSISLTIKL